VIEFNPLEKWVRRHFQVYLILRRIAPFICRFIDLEEGFSILKYVLTKKDTNLVVIDAGSNDGTSMRMIRRYLKHTKIIAIDPVQRPKFRTSNFSFFDIALGNSESEALLYTPIVRNKRLTQYSSFFSENVVDAVMSDSGVKRSEIGLEEKLVFIKTIDILDLQPIFIKIDVEGFELQVLQGATNTLNLNKPILLVEILSEVKYQEIAFFLKSLNYMNVFPNFPKNRNSLNIEVESFIQTTRNYVWVPISDAPYWSFK